MKWSDAQKTAESMGDGGKFVVLKNPGDKIQGLFMGEPHIIEQFWNGSTYVPFDATNLDHDRVSTRFYLNFYDINERKMKIIQGGAKWFRDILKVRDKFGLDEQIYEIERQGTGTTTTYSILPERRLQPIEKKMIVETPLHNLSEL